MNVQQIMHQPAITCRPDDTLNTAARLMWENDCGAIPVVDDDGGVVGIVTDRDACMCAYTQGQSLHEIPVSNAMARKVFSVRQNDPLQVAERLMSENQVRRVPVVDGDNRPIGVLSMSDIARSAREGGNGLDRELTETLAAICRPRAMMVSEEQAAQQSTRAS